METMAPTENQGKTGEEGLPAGQTFFFGGTVDFFGRICNNRDGPVHLLDENLFQIHLEADAKEVGHGYETAVGEAGTEGRCGSLC